MSDYDALLLKKLIEEENHNFGANMYRFYNQLAAFQNHHKILMDFYVQSHDYRIARINDKLKEMSSLGNDGNSDVDGNINSNDICNDVCNETCNDMVNIETIDNVTDAQPIKIETGENNETLSESILNNNNNNFSNSSNVNENIVARENDEIESNSNDLGLDMPALEFESGDESDRIPYDVPETDQCVSCKVSDIIRRCDKKSNSGDEYNPYEDFSDNDSDCSGVYPSKSRDDFIHCQCSYCFGKFTSMTSLKRHKNQCESKPISDKVYKCSHCFNSFETRSDLCQHVRNVHSGMNIYKCRWCNKKFAKKSLLTTHGDKCKKKCLKKSRTSLKTTQKHSYKFNKSKQNKKLSNKEGKWYCKECDQQFHNGKAWGGHQSKLIHRKQKK